MSVPRWIRSGCLTSLTLASALHAQGSTWVEVERREPLAAGKSAEDVRRDALHAAIAEAVRRVAGVRVQGTETATRSESAGRVVDRYSQALRLDVEGRAIDWEIVHEEWRTARPGAPGSPVSYDLTLRVLVERDHGVADPGFVVRVTAANERLIVRGDTPAANDEVIARVSSTRDASIVLVSIADDSVFVLAPNDVMPETRVAAREGVELPSAELRGSGLHFRATLPAGVERRMEILAAVATRHPVPLPSRPGSGVEKDTGVLTLAEFNRWLVSIPLGERATGQTTVEVMRIP